MKRRLVKGNADNIPAVAEAEAPFGEIGNFCFGKVAPFNAYFIFEVDNFRRKLGILYVYLKRFRIADILFGKPFRFGIKSAGGELGFLFALLFGFFKVLPVKEACKGENVLAVKLKLGNKP